MRKASVSTIATLAGSVLLLVGCGSETTTSAVENTAVAPTECWPASPITDPELAVFADGLQLPEGASVVTGRVSTDSDHPGEVGVALDLCVPGTADVDALRPIATGIARALRPTPLGERTFVLYVSDVGPEFNTEAKLKDPNFQSNLWNGKPSADAENAGWEAVGR